MNHQFHIRHFRQWAALAGLLTLTPAYAQTCQNDGRIWGVSSVNKQLNTMTLPGGAVTPGPSVTASESYIGDIAWGYDNRLYGLGFGSSVSPLYVINPATGATTTVARLSGQSNALGSLPNNRLLYANYRTSLGGFDPNIYFYDVATGRQGVWSTIPGTNVRSAGDITYLNGRVYAGFSNSVNTYIYVFDVDAAGNPVGTPRVLTTIAGADQVFGITGLEGRLYLTAVDAGAQNSVFEVNLSTGTRVTTAAGQFANDHFGLATQPQAYGGTCLPPLAQPDTGSVGQNFAASTTRNSVTVGVLSNDSAQTPGNFLRADSVLFTAAGQPAGSVITEGGKVLTNADGVYRVNADGTVTFTPASGQPPGQKAPVTYQVSDANFKTVTSTLTITVTPAPQVSDLRVSKAGPAFAAPGGTVTYTVRVWAEGTAALDATVSDPVPVLQGVTWTCAATAGASCSAASGSGNPALSVTLQPDAATTPGPDTVYATITVTGTAPQATTLAADAGSRAWTNTAAVSSPGDSDPGNNTASASTQTVYTALQKQVRNIGPDGTQAPPFGTAAQALPGDLLEYCVQASNLGGAPLTGHRLEDGLQPNQKYREGSAALSGDVGGAANYDAAVTSWDPDGQGGQGTPISVNGLVSADIGTLGSGQSVRLCFRAEVE